MRNFAISASASATRRVGRDGHRVDDHARLRALDLVDLGGLRRDRQVLVDEAEPALLGEGDGQGRLGHGVHRGGHDRDLERDRCASGAWRRRPARAATLDAAARAARRRMSAPRKGTLEHPSSSSRPDAHGSAGLTPRDTSCTSSRCRKGRGRCGRPSCPRGGPSARRPSRPWPRGALGLGEGGGWSAGSLRIRLRAGRAGEGQLGRAGAGARRALAWRPASSASPRTGTGW